MIGRVLAALLRGTASQLHPAMLVLLLLPFLLAAVGWGLVAWWVWDPLLDWLRVSIFSGGWLGWIVDVPARFGLEGLRGVLAVLIALMLVLPLWFATALVITAVLAMPAVMRFLSGGAYKDLQRRGGWSVAASVWNGVSSLALFVVGYLLTLPLWLLPPLAIVVPWFWWSWLTARVMRFDSLVEHADDAERAAVIARHKREFLLLGAAVTVLNYVPPLFLITPVLSALVFGHFALSRLREERARLKADWIVEAADALPGTPVSAPREAIGRAPDDSAPGESPDASPTPGGEPPRTLH